MGCAKPDEGEPVFWTERARMDGGCTHGSEVDVNRVASPAACAWALSRRRRAGAQLAQVAKYQGGGAVPLIPRRS